MPRASELAAALCLQRAIGGFAGDQDSSAGSADLGDVTTEPTAKAAHGYVEQMCEFGTTKGVLKLVRNRHGAFPMDW